MACNVLWASESWLADEANMMYVAEARSYGGVRLTLASASDSEPDAAEWVRTTRRWLPAGLRGGRRCGRRRGAEGAGLLGCAGAGADARVVRALGVPGLYGQGTSR